MRTTTRAGTRRTAAAIDPAQIAVTDAMTWPVVTVAGDTNVHEAAKIMVRNHVSGLLVLDGEGKPFGVISETDIVGYETRRRTHLVDWQEGRRLEKAAAREIHGPFHLEHIDDEMAAEIMTPGVVSVPPEDPVGEVAKLMFEKHIHRVFVEKNGKIVGVVTALDVARVMGKHWKG